MLCSTPELTALISSLEVLGNKPCIMAHFKFKVAAFKNPQSHGASISLPFGCDLEGK
jgi:hypothetical protein